MRLIVFFIVVVFLISCKQTAVQQKISGSDSLVIHFNEPGSDTLIAKTIQTTESKAIQQFSKLLGEKKAEKFKCGYDGSMVFFEKGMKKIDISFKYSEEVCRHFIYVENGDLISLRMNQEAADLLKSLAEGRSWY